MTEIKGSHWRNGYHVEMPYGLINDPNGLSYYEGEFHIFYQWNPNGCDHKTKHWGLVRTKDFVTYSKPEIVLRPEDWFDKNGCYSGGAIEVDGVLKLFYTGNVKGEQDQRISYQCVADYTTGRQAKKGGVVIPAPPRGYTSHFRDPMVFLENGRYYMIIGAQTEGLEGAALLYTSPDAMTWSLVGPLETGLSPFGYMWECPNLFSVGQGLYGFLFSPQGLLQEGLRYQNLYQSGYVIGKLDVNEATLSGNGSFKELDMGFDFYAPQVFSYEGQSVMMGWVGMPDKEEEYPSGEYGWRFCLTLPRVLECLNGVLYQRPLKLLEGLRKEAITVLPEQTGHGWHMDFEQRQLECKLELELSDLFSSPKVLLRFGGEWISIQYNQEDGICTVNRTHMKLGGRGIRRFPLQVVDGHGLRIHLFVDNSVMEIFFQDGAETVTMAYFPVEEKFAVEIVECERICDVQVWKSGC